MITKLGMLAAVGAAALTTAYSAPAQAWGWHGGYARPGIGISFGAPVVAAAPVVTPYGYGGYGGYGAYAGYGYGGYGYGYRYPAAYGSYGYGYPAYYGGYTYGCGC